MKRWQLWLGLIISTIFLFFALRGLDFSEIWSALKSANYFWLIPAVLIYFIGLWLRAVRWRIFLHPIKALRIGKLFAVTAIGYMGNNIYPARLGELIRAYVLKREDNIPVSTSLATIIIERVFDSIVMLGFILLNLSVINEMSHSIEIRQTIDTVSIWGTVIFFTTFFVFILSAIFPEKISRLYKTILGWLLPEKINSKFQGIVDKFFSGIQALASPLNTIYALLLTIIIWLIETGFYWFVMRSFPFQVSFGTLMLMNGFLNIFTIIPSSPGYIGTFDAPGIALLSALGIDQQLSAGYTLLLHATLWLPVTIAGAYFFARKGLKWDEAIESVEKEKGL